MSKMDIEKLQKRAFGHRHFAAMEAAA